MRIKFIIYFIIAISLLLLGRVYFLSIKSNAYYTQLSEQNYIKQIPLKPTRGVIKDRNGEPIAINKLGFSISITPHLRSVKNTQKLNKLLDTIIFHFPQLDKKKLFKTYRRNDSAYRHDFVEVVDYIDYDEFFSKYTIFNENKDFEITAVDKRFYPYGSVAAHVVGYTGKASRLEIEKNSIAEYTKFIGKTGLEYVYNEKLQGQIGFKKVKVNALNKVVEVLEEQKPSKDNDITTTIDIKLQEHIHNIFDKKMPNSNERRSGAVVVMDIKNGEILAGGSFPEYDSNLFVNGISHDDWSKVINDFNHPFTNKLVNGIYPPGSVVKMGVALSFLRNGLSKNFHVFCDGEITVGNRKFRCWKEKGHGSVGFRKAIRESCDDFFYKGSLKVGIDNIHDTLQELGFGEKTNVDQKNEYIGINPSKYWKQMKYGQSWFKGETLNASIGQGFFLVTPLQVARYTGGIASNILQTPHFIKDNIKPQRVLNIKEENLKIMQQGMLDVTTHVKGTATRHIHTPLQVAAKTGTAQVVGIPQSEKKRMKEHELEYFKRSHAWLTTYAPYDNPQYVITVLVEHGGHGGSAAGGIVSSIYNKLIELNYIKQ
jgi:penicillin-binding protein 2